MDGERSQEEKTTAAQAAQSGFPYFDSRELTDIPVVDDEISLEVLHTYHVAPLHRYDTHGIELGLTPETDTTRLPELQQELGTVKLTFKTISAAGYNDILNRTYYKMFEAERNGDFERFGSKLAKAAPKQAFQFIAQLGFWLGSSDIHIEPHAKATRIRFRIDGVLHPITDVSTESYKIFLSDLQTRAEIKWGSDMPQSGRISFTLMNNDAALESVNMRIETVPALHGEEIVVRIFNTSTQELHLDMMGFNAAQIAKISKVAAHPNGMMLTVGPTGSGKTSTLYSLINELNNPETKIITLEDPIEYDLPGITQIPVRTEDKESFAEKLRAVMREDPNVVMIGEIRDIDTAKTALQAALTGHLVLSTYHANNAAAAVSRMLDMVGKNPLFASAIRLIVAQRLARRICKHCIEEVEPTKKQVEFITQALKDIPAERRPKTDTNIVLKHGKGCKECHGLGYKGRIAVIEMMTITPDLEKLMTMPDRTTAQDIENLATRNGMITMLEDGLHKALEGITTIDEIMGLFEA